MENIREPVVAGMFYPGSEKALRQNIEDLLNQAEIEENYDNICGIVSPHAGYPYSGLSAAYAFNVLNNYDFETAIILSPSHREYFPGISVFEGDAYKTPLGILPVDKNLADKIVNESDNIFKGVEGHRGEHAIEVQLPFLQSINDNAKIVPIVVGDQRKNYIDEIADKLAAVISDRNVIIASSDLSHFRSKDDANRIDSIVEDHIKNFDYENLLEDLESKKCEACGGGGIVALMKAAKLCDYNNINILSRTDSGDFSGDNSSVVGYLSAVIN